VIPHYERCDTDTNRCKYCTPSPRQAKRCLVSDFQIASSQHNPPKAQQGTWQSRSRQFIVVQHHSTDECGERQESAGSMQRCGRGNSSKTKCPCVYTLNAHTCRYKTPRHANPKHVQQRARNFNSETDCSGRQRCTLTSITKEKSTKQKFRYPNSNRLKELDFTAQNSHALKVGVWSDVQEHRDVLTRGWFNKYTLNCR
jgi:hypothetical protein